MQSTDPWAAFNPQPAPSDAGSPFGNRPVIHGPPPAPKEARTTYHVLSQAEVEKLGLAPGTYQMSSEGNISKVAGSQADEKTVESLARLYVTNKLVPPTRPNEVAQQAIARAMELDPSYDPALAGNRSKAIKDFSGNGQAAQVVRSVNRLANHLNDMWEASEKMGGPNFGFKPLNSLVASIEQSGEPKLTAQYDAALPGVANEIDKILRGTGSPTVSGIQESIATLKRARSLDERRAAFKQIAGLIHGALDPIKQSWNSAYGGDRAPPMWVSPHAAAVFGKIDPDNASTFGGDDWRGLPGLQGVGDQPTASPGANAGMGSPGDPSGSMGPDGAGSGGGDAMVAPTNGQQRTTYDPRLSSQVDAMVNAGASKAMIDAVLKRQGFPPIRAADYSAAKDWMAKNPGQKYFGANITRNEDLNLGQRILANPAIAPVAAGVARAGDAASAGILGAMTGEEGRGALDAMGQLHPDAALLGDTAGAIAGSLGGEAIAGKALTAIPSALKAAPVLGDMLYGGTLGLNRAQDGEGGTGALEGAAAGLGGNLLMRGLGKAVRGVANPAVQRLRAAGIPLTAGEVLGGGYKKAQDALTSVFGPGDMVARRYAEGRQALNDVAFNQGGAVIGAPINATGNEGISVLNAAKSDAFSKALDPISLNVGPAAFDPIASAADAIPAGELSPGYGGTMIRRYVHGNIDPATGMMSGPDFQKAYRGLAQTASKAAPKIEGHDIGEALGQAKDVLSSTLQTQNPAAFDAFLKANSANRHLSILRDAVGAAKNQDGQLFTPAQLNTAAFANTTKFGGKTAAASGAGPYQQLATDAQQVMSSKLPDSGTAKRLAMLGLATGAGGVGGYGLDGGQGATEGGLGLALLLAAGGSKPAQKIMVKALADRPDIAKQAGNLIYNRGWVGSGVLNGLLTGP